MQDYENKILHVLDKTIDDVRMCACTYITIPNYERYDITKCDIGYNLF